MANIWAKKKCYKYFFVPANLTIYWQLLTNTLTNTTQQLANLKLILRLPSSVCLLPHSKSTKTLIAHGVKTKTKVSLKTILTMLHFTSYCRYLWKTISFVLMGWAIDRSIWNSKQIRFVLNKVALFSALMTNWPISNKNIRCNCQL